MRYLSSLLFSFICCNCLFLANVFSQPTITLSKTVGSSGTESIHDLIADQDGHIIALGQCDSVDRDTSCHYHGGSTDIWLVKMDAAGNILWQKCYGGSEEDNAYQIIQTTDGGFLFTGVTFSSDGDVAVNQGYFYQVWIVKTDSNGNIQWQQGLIAAKTYDLMQLHNGKYLIACYTINSSSSFPVHYGGGFVNDAWLTWINNDGTIDTSRIYGGTADDYITQIIELPDHDLQLFGYTESIDYDLVGTSANGFRDGWIFRTDSNGSIKWTKRWGGNLPDAIDGAVLLPNKNFLTAGSSDSNQGDFLSNHGSSDVWIMLLDSVANRISNYLYGGSNTDAMDFRRRIHSANNGIFTVGALSYSSDGDVGFNHGYSDFWFFAIDSNGVLVNSKVVGGSWVDDLYCNSLHEGNTALLGGLTASDDFDVHDYHGNGDGWIVEIGNFTMVGEVVSESVISIYPNPLHSQFMLSSTDENVLNNATLEIYSSNGILMATKKSAGSRKPY